MSYNPPSAAHNKLDREVDGRWIADVPKLNLLLYGDSRQDAIERAKPAARELIADQISRGVLPADAANPKFAVAA